MRKVRLTVAACATLLWAGTALGASAPTPQQLCNSARITAWKTYQSCVDTVVAKDAKGFFTYFGPESAAFAKCRHAYYTKWKGFQSNGSMTGSTCKVGVDNRFTEDLVDGVVTDNLTGLVWELKSDLDGVTDFTNPHDADNSYSWSASSTIEDGTAFTDFLAKVNGGAGFGGANGWRLPTLAELQTIVLDFPCTGAFGTAKCRCPSTPCVYSVLDAANTQSSYYWSATSYVPNPFNAWFVGFNFGDAFSFSPYYDGFKTDVYYVRAVRGGL